MLWLLKLPPLPAALPLSPVALSTPSIASLSSSFSSTLTSSPAHMRIVGCHTMTILSSDTLAAVQFSASPGAQQRSVGRAVCPGSQCVLLYTKVYIFGKAHLRGRKVTRVHRLLDHRESVLPQFAANPICLFVCRSTPTQRLSGCGETNLNGESHLCVIQIHGVSVKGNECRAK